jgi:uncharacterized protein YjiS (DUF1127 family)
MMSTYQHSVPVCMPTREPRTFLERVENVFASVVAAGTNYLQARERRRAFHTLNGLDDRMLDDIGLSRFDVETAAGLPLEINASLAVRQIAAERRAREYPVRRRR